MPADALRVSTEASVAELRPARVGVVLAAGRSERLSDVTGGGSKALVRVGGLPLVERAVRNLRAAGVSRVIVVVGHHAEPVAEHVARIGPPDEVQAVLADNWVHGNAASLAAAEAVLPDGPFVVVTADHVFSEGALDGLLASHEPAVLVDPRPSPEVWAEGTKVSIEDGRAVAFGKHLEDPAVDCGAFVLTPEIFSCIAQGAAEGDHTLAGAVSRFAAQRPLRAVPIPFDAWWQDVDTPDDLRAAGTLLRRSLTKPTDGPVSRWINRPISSRLSMALASLRPHPDIVSVLAFLIAIAGAGLLATGYGVAGGILVLASSILDGTDGELARLQFRARPQGAMLDGVLDRIGDTAILLALGIWALDATSLSPTAVLILTVTALCGALMSMATKDRASALGLPKAPERALGRLLGGRDGRLLLVGAAAIAALPVVGLAAVAVTSLGSSLVRAALVLR